MVEDLAYFFFVIKIKKSSLIQKVICNVACLARGYAVRRFKLKHNIPAYLMI